MSRITTPAKPRPAGNSVMLEDTDWRTYSQLLRAFAAQPHGRQTWERGRLDIMSPLFAHDNESRFFAFLVQVLTDARAAQQPCAASYGSAGSESTNHSGLPTPDAYSTGGDSTFAEIHRPTWPSRSTSATAAWID